MASHRLRAALATTVAFTGCVGALRGEVVLFDNSAGTFVWIANAGTGPGGAFDPTLAPGQQGNFAESRRLRYSASLGGSGTIVSADFIAMGSAIRIAGNPVPTRVFGPNPGQEREFLHAATFQIGEQVGPNAPYPAPVNINVGYFNVNLGRHGFLGQHPFVGFWVILGDGLPRYGWIEFDYRESLIHPDGDRGLMYQPIRWAYETEPNTPITVVPSPGAVSLLGVAAIGAWLSTPRGSRGVWAR